MKHAETWGKTISHRDEGSEARTPDTRAIERQEVCSKNNLMAHAIQFKPAADPWQCNFLTPASLSMDLTSVAGYLLPDSSTKTDHPSLFFIYY
jgi:hypothetical protein